MSLLKFIYDKITGLVRGKSQPLASGPYEFTITDWKIALMATKDAIASKQIGILAAGIAYFATFAFFPLVAASVAIASLVISHDQLKQVVDSVEAFLPSDIAGLVTTQLEAAFSNQASSIAIAIVGILISLFSISGAVINLISASNVAYERSEDRGFIKLRLTSLGIMLAGLIVGGIIISLLLLNKPLLLSFGVPLPLAIAIPIIRWLVIALLISTMLAVFYRYGPNRSKPKWQWVTWGSVLASVIWLIGTAAFFVYARYFANFSEAYSVFAGIIVLMTWFNLTSFIVLLGAEINFRLESQTFLKTTK